MAKRLRSIQYLYDQMKIEVAQEMGIQLGANTSSRLNGVVGGEVTKRMVAIAEAGLMDVARSL